MCPFFRDLLFALNLLLFGKRTEKKTYEVKKKCFYCLAPFFNESIYCCCHCSYCASYIHVMCIILYIPQHAFWKQRKLVDLVSSFYPYMGSKIWTQMVKLVWPNSSFLVITMYFICLHMCARTHALITSEVRNRCWISWAWYKLLVPGTKVLSSAGEY